MYRYRKKWTHWVTYVNAGQKMKTGNIQVWKEKKKTRRRDEKGAVVFVASKCATDPLREKGVRLRSHDWSEREGGVEGRTDGTVCHDERCSKKDPVTTLLSNKDSMWICCMYGFSGLSSIHGSIYVGGVFHSQQFECFSLLRHSLCLVSLSVLLNSEKRTN